MQKYASLIILAFILISCKPVNMSELTTIPTSAPPIATNTNTSEPKPASTPSLTPAPKSIYAPFDGKEWGEGNIDFTCYGIDIGNIQKNVLSLSDDFSVFRWAICNIKDSVTGKDTQIVMPLVSYNSETEFLAFAFTLDSAPMPKHNLNDEFIDAHLQKVLGAVQASGKIDILVTTGNNSGSLLMQWNPYEAILSPEIWGNIMLEFGKTGDTSRLPLIDDKPIVIPYRVSVAK